MIDSAFLGRLRVEPLDRKRHDRTAFRCGVERIDHFLAVNAARQQHADLTRVYVTCLDAAFDVVGYYALNAHGIDASTLPPALARKLPSCQMIAAIYLSMVGFHIDHQGKGGGSFLMADAFRRCANAANIIGAHFLVLDALNERAAKLYRELGFVDLPDHPSRMIISMKMIRQAIEERGP
jgi:ribosomal protein S18 acetylase RimI-like enzyme